MVRSSLRCLAGGALTLIVLTGCSSRSPFTDTLDAERSRHPQAARADASTLSRGYGDESAPLPVLDETAKLEDYLRYAALENPGLEAMFQDWKAAVERLPQVSTLPDPRFTYGYYLGEVETRVGPMQHSLALSQTFPWFGKLQDREDAAGRHANAAYERFEAARLALFLRVERAYNELFYLKRSIDITHENIELLQQFERVARTRYRVAAASHPDLIKIQVELGTLEDRLRQLRDLRDPYGARLNAALNRPSGSPIPWPTAVSEREVSVDDEKLLAALSERNPELLALQEEIEVTGTRQHAVEHVVGREIVDQANEFDEFVGQPGAGHDEEGQGIDIERRRVSDAHLCLAKPITVWLKELTEQGWIDRPQDRGLRETGVERSGQSRLLAAVPDLTLGLL